MLSTCALARVCSGSSSNVAAGLGEPGASVGFDDGVAPDNRLDRPLPVRGPGGGLAVLGVALLEATGGGGARFFAVFRSRLLPLPGELSPPAGEASALPGDPTSLLKLGEPTRTGELPSSSDERSK